MLSIPKHINGVEDSILNPENSWKDKAMFKETVNKVADFFIKNFEKFTDTAEGKRLREFGPKM